MSENYSVFLRRAALVILGIGGVWLALRFFLPLAAPLVAAYAAAMLLEPAVRHLSRRMPRSAASGLACVGAVAAALGILRLLCATVVSELRGLMENLPGLISQTAETLRTWREAVYIRLGTEPGGWMDAIMDGMETRLSAIPGAVSAWLLGVLPQTASRAPGVLMFAATAVIGTYFVSASYPQIKQAAEEKLPERLQQPLGRFSRSLHGSFGKWLKAQVILTAITFGELIFAFVLLRVNYFLILAAVIAVIDALPILGTGTVLIPWAVYALVSGDTSLGVGLAVTYGAVTVVRSLIQPKLLGDQLGLHPLVSLASIYGGYRLMGVWGMIIFPIAAISLRQFTNGGENEQEEKDHERGNFQHHSRHGHEHTGRDEYTAR